MLTDMVETNYNLLSHMKQVTTTTSSTVRATLLTDLSLFQVAALADLGRPEDAVPILRTILDTDVPSQRKQTLSEEVVNKTKHILEIDDSYLSISWPTSPGRVLFILGCAYFSSS